MTAPSEAALSADDARCRNCRAVCCRLTVVLQPGDTVPDRYIDDAHYGLPVMARLHDGWCVALDRDSFRCTIHAIRPQVCRDFDEGGRDCRLERAAHPELARARDPL